MASSLGMWYQGKIGERYVEFPSRTLRISRLSEFSKWNLG